MIDGLGSFGSSIALLLLTLAIFSAGACAGIQGQRRSGSAGIGWLVAIIVMVGLALVFKPTMEALNRAQCKGVHDYQSCIDPHDQGGF